MMNPFKKKIWTLFFIIAFIFSSLLAIGIYLKKNTFNQENQNQQHYLLTVFQNNFIAQLKEQEFILDILTDQYLHKKTINNAQVAVLLNQNKLLTQLSLFSPSGQLLYSSHPVAGLPPIHKTWFKQAIDSNKMVIGKSYLSNNGKQVIPIAKRILDKHNKTIAVINSELSLEGLESPWQGSNRYKNSLQVTLDKTYTNIINFNIQKKTAINKNHLSSGYIYNKYSLPLSDQEEKNSVFAHHSDDNSLPSALTKMQFKKLVALNSLKQQASNYPTSPVQLTVTPNEFNKSLLTLQFNQKYNLWFSISTNDELLNNRFNEAITYYILVYLAFIFILICLFVWIDDTNQQKLQEITFQARHDRLTHLYNYSELEAQFTEAIAKENACLSLLYIDLRHFKNINDSFGYRYGDFILQEVTKRILTSLTHLPATAFRHHGAKFIILLHHQDPNIIKDYAKSLLQSLALPYIIHNSQFQINSTIGISIYPNHADDIETLLNYAENSTHRGKRTQNRITFFSLEDHRNLMQKIEIQQALQLAIKNKEISLVYQPQIGLNNQICGVEALVRWHSKKLGVIPPNIFIPIAEEIGIMPELGHYILCTALQEISSFHKREQTSFTLSVNVSVRQFIQVDFFATLLQACRSHKAKEVSLILEITESLFIENIAVLLPTFNLLKTHNIQLSLDDFGTGYSSLSMLRRVPIDELKIDKSFIDHITENETDRLMLASIISMGKNLGLSVLAEGVETIDQLELLRSSECDLIQGYYFSKPLTLEALSDFVRKNQTE